MNQELTSPQPTIPWLPAGLFVAGSAPNAVFNAPTSRTVNLGGTVLVQASSLSNPLPGMINNAAMSTRPLPLLDQVFSSLEAPTVANQKGDLTQFAVISGRETSIDDDNGSYGFELVFRHDLKRRDR
jgi:hypothetical protein